MGYHQAFPDAEIVGVDIEPHPAYPFYFWQGDACATIFDFSGFDLIHASPPCHDFSTATGKDRKANGSKGTGWMLAATIERLSTQLVPWVVENVVAAPMPGAFTLCGSSFGLDVRRHRKFLTSFPVAPKPCNHGWQTPRFPSLNNAHRKEGRLASVVGVHGHLQYAGEFAVRCAAMGIDWMSNDALAQSIPPAYTRYIGEQFSLT